MVGLSPNVGSEEFRRWQEAKRTGVWGYLVAKEVRGHLLDQPTNSYRAYTLRGKAVGSLLEWRRWCIRMHPRGDGTPDIMGV